MRKSKLTKEAIIFLVSAYEDKTNSYRFIDIMDMVKSKFGIDVSAEAIRKAYHKHKQDSTLSTEEVLKTKEKPNVKTKLSMSELRGIVKSDLTEPKDFDTSYEDISKDELDSLFTSPKDN